MVGEHMARDLREWVQGLGMWTASISAANPLRRWVVVCVAVAVELAVEPGLLIITPLSDSVERVICESAVTRLWSALAVFTSMRGPWA